MVREMTLGMSGRLFRQSLSCSPKGPLDHHTCPPGTMTQLSAPLLPSRAHHVTERDVDDRDELAHENTLWPTVPLLVCDFP